MKKNKVLKKSYKPKRYSIQYIPLLFGGDPIYLPPWKYSASVVSSGRLVSSPLDDLFIDIWMSVMIIDHLRTQMTKR